MCAITSMIHRDGTTVAPQDLATMNNLARHRGPDGEGYFFGSNFALGHRRLAITDLHERAAQPMNLDGYVVVFNGEIYNYKTIRTALKNSGIPFSTESDTVVLLQAYKTWGTQCVTKMDGMWSFLIYDPLQNLLFGSRDRFGMKPFYYACDDSRCYIASEVRQILPFIPRQEGNTVLIIDYLLAGLEEHTQETFFKDIHKLLPGHNFIYDLKNHHLHIEPYYELRAATNLPPETPEKVSEMVRRAVILRSNTEVKTGIMLSGGLDSAILAACLPSRDIGSIHAAATGHKDESNHAQTVADHLGIAFHVFRPVMKHWQSDVDEVIKVQEEPFGSPSVIMQYKVMQEAKKNGIKVLFDGQGADELFLGYRPYFFKILTTKSLIEKVKIIRANLTFISRNWVSTFIFYCFIKYDWIKRIYFKRHKNIIHPYIQKYFRLKTCLTKHGSGQKMSDWQLLEIQKTQLPALLRYEDKNAMSQGIETRLPYLDHHLAEFAVALPDDQKINIQGTKFALRKAFEDKLPADIIWRKDKIGFEAPSEWMAEHREGMATEIKNSPLLKTIIRPRFLSSKMNDGLLWRFYCLSRWAKLYDIHQLNVCQNDL